MWYTYIPNMRSVQASLLEISCLQGFTNNLTPVDLWPPPKTIGFLYSMWLHLHTKYEICPSFPSWDIVFTRLLQCFHNMTPVDLWPPPKTIGFLYSMWHSYIPNMRSVQASLLEISCLQGFNNLTLLKWPLTSTKNNRLLVLNVALLHTKYEICPSFLVEISCLQGFSQCWHPVDPCWPLTSTKNNRLLVLNVALLHTKYEICPSFPCWDIVFTRFSQFDPVDP